TDKPINSLQIAMTNQFWSNHKPSTLNLQPYCLLLLNTVNILPQRLFYIRNNIVNMLKANRNPYRSIGNTYHGLIPFRQFIVGSRSRVGYDTSGISQIGGKGQ